jgi:RES domain-containing protein
MLVWRLCRRPHADLSGEGGRLVSGRWHTAGRPVVYTAYEPALAILEVLVHLDIPIEDLPDDYVMMGIDITKLEAAVFVVSPRIDSISDSQAFGDAWLVGKTSAVIGVPSVLSPRGVNFLINPLHPNAKDATIAEIEDFKFDGRLWKGANPT